MVSYGHGVLRKSDPRFIALQEFCDTRPDLLKSPTIQLVKKVRLPADELPRISALTTFVRKTYEVAPGVLTEHGKVSRRTHAKLCGTNSCTFMTDTPNRLRIRGPMLTLPLVR